jgi:hypothetical protein
MAVVVIRYLPRPARSGGESQSEGRADPTLLPVAGPD